MDFSIKFDVDIFANHRVWRSFCDVSHKDGHCRTGWNRLKRMRLNDDFQCLGNSLFWASVQSEVVVPEPDTEVLEASLQGGPTAPCPPEASPDQNPSEVLPAAPDLARTRTSAKVQAQSPDTLSHSLVNVTSITYHSFGVHSNQGNDK